MRGELVVRCVKMRKSLEWPLEMQKRRKIFSLIFKVIRKKVKKVALNICTEKKLAIHLHSQKQTSEEQNG